MLRGVFGTVIWDKGLAGFGCDIVRGVVTGWLLTFGTAGHISGLRWWCRVFGEFPAMTSKATRSEISQALAKAIAYRDCGKPAEAAAWAAKLVRMLEAQQILAKGY
jgi:hypothetical protein